MENLKKNHSRRLDYFAWANRLSVCFDSAWSLNSVRPYIYHKLEIWIKVCRAESNGCQVHKKINSQKTKRKKLSSGMSRTRDSCFRTKHSTTPCRRADAVRVPAINKNLIINGPLCENLNLNFQLIVKNLITKWKNKCKFKWDFSNSANFSLY